MTTARSFYEQRPGLSILPQKDWPTMYDLPSEDPQEPGLPDEFHALQPQLLSATLSLTTVAKDQVFTGTDLNLYYDFDHPTWYKRPDWFAVAGVPRLYDGRDLRLSYVIWDEQVSPWVVVELISPGTAMSDLGEVKREQNGTPTKWQVYEQIIKVQNYVVFDRYKNQLWIFKLVEGQYQQQPIDGDRFWFDEMAIGLGVWQGEYEGMTRPWLRWYDADGHWIPTPQEQLDQERRRLENETQKREAAELKAARLAARLRELGLDAEDL